MSEFGAVIGIIGAIAAILNAYAFAFWGKEMINLAGFVGGLIAFVLQISNIVALFS